MIGTLTIRADCSLTMGTGHVMRMIALGQAWQTLGGNVRIIGQISALNKRLLAEGFDQIPLNAVHPDPADADALTSATNAGDWIAIDGYHFDTAYQKTIRNSGRKTLVLDDLFDRGAYDADILLNQNPDGTQYPYKINGQLLLGTKYALLRKEFHQQEPSETIAAKATNILVTLGGADPDDMTGTVLSAIDEAKDTTLHVKVVAGAANPNLPILQAMVKKLPYKCELLTAVDDMPSIMTWADLAISAAGTTTWELCYFGVPFIAIEIADNQKGIIRELKRHGTALCLDRKASLRDIVMKFKELVSDQDARQKMRASSKKLVDGKGAMRVVKALYNADIHLRPAKAQDCEMLLEWRNDPVTRANSFTTEAISLNTHRNWFETKLTDNNCLFLIAEDRGNIPVGQIRFDLEDNDATVSVSVAPAVMNRGVGTTMTSLGCAELHEKWPNATAVALVKKDNPASISMFEKAGFAQNTTTNDHLRFVWSSKNNDA